MTGDEGFVHFLNSGLQTARILTGSEMLLVFTLAEQIKPQGFQRFDSQLYLFNRSEWASRTDEELTGDGVKRHRRLMRVKSH